MLFFQSEPPSPPSAVALNRKNLIDSSNNNNTQEGDKGEKSDNQSSSDHYASFKQELTVLFTDRNFVILFTVFSLGLGLFNALLTLLFQFIQPYGYSNDDAGNFGAAFIVAGLIGSALAGWILNKYKRYNLTLKVYIVLVVTAILVFVCELSSDNLAALLISFIYLGFTMLTLLPIFMETCAETTYPVSEDVSVGALLVGMLRFYFISLLF
jgi:Na+/melibiose symporter-like transporter